MGRRRTTVAVVSAAVSLLAVAAALAASSGQQATRDTLVFGVSTDPVGLDPSLISDGESLRVTDQIFESLTGFQVGGSKVVPELATSWRASRNGLAWTFNLRRNVRFSDGTPFNSAAVCFNYNRWYNFPGPLQNASVSYYWNTVFGGFARPVSGSPGPAKSLYRGCRTNGANSVTILLRRPSTSFLSAIGLPNFGIASPAALRRYQANAGTVDASGVFHPKGTFSTANPVGTGPYMLRSWRTGDRLELVRNPSYWGRKAILNRIIFRPIPDNAARLQALQTGEIHGYDGVAPEDIRTIQRNSKFRLVTRPTSSVGYVGINQAMKPMDNLLVRQAIAYGLDRPSLVKAFYPPGTQVANQFLPPSLIGHARSGVTNYPYNPEKARSLLEEAGLTLPVKIDMWYPTDVTRPYMPDPSKNFQAFAASLEKSGFDVTAHTAPWRPDYLGGAQGGKYQVYLFGWISDYYDPANFLNVHFGAFSPQFGFRAPQLFSLLTRADAETNLDTRAALYRRAGVQVMRILPMVPYVWAGSALGFDRSVRGFVPGPIGPVNEPLSRVSLG